MASATLAAAAATSASAQPKIMKRNNQLASAKISKGERADVINQRKTLTKLESGIQP